MAFYFPIILVIVSNTMYHILAKKAPSEINPFTTLVVTYSTAAMTSLILLFLNKKGNALSTFAPINWIPFAFGLALVGLEFGYLKAYSIGWNLSIGSLVSNIFLAIILALVGVLFYKEHLSISQILGICLCLVGIFFVTKK